ncbi:MAG: DUF2828 family protein [Firmicutes bacterium]|nr:DUF2828 family protein [Bacillota bacterium]
MNKFLNGLTDATNFTYTENGAITHKTTKSALLDMFALGGAYRTRSDAEVITLFKNAYEENPVYALKCLFYLRDVRGGQGERRFFKTAMKWFANADVEAARRNFKHIPEFGRWDDLYLFINTPLENEMFQFMKEQLALDMQCKTPSLLAKWLKSENTSSMESRYLAKKTRQYFGMTAKQYRKTLSILRERINVLERLMSAGKWDEIEFDKIPSKAGLIYKNAFARHDIERMKTEKAVVSYADFAKDVTTTVNAKALYPYEVVAKAIDLMGYNGGWFRSTHDVPLDNTDRLMINKYWNNLADYIQGANFNGIAVVDTSGSMTGSFASAPINVAVSLGMYCAEKNNGPFKDHFITFESNPHLIKVEGVDFCEKVYNITGADWGGSTNIEAVFDLLLDTAIRNNCSQDEIPQNVIVISDMEFNSCVTFNSLLARRYYNEPMFNTETLFETMERKWNRAGYQMPAITFWNVQARQNNIPMKTEGRVNYVSGMSPVIYEQVMKGLSAYDLMMDKLDNERYSVIC